MTFKNYGEWQVDHVIPVASFDLTKLENYFKCFNYKNLQPLWKEDNKKKSSKLDFIVPERVPKKESNYLFID